MTSAQLSRWIKNPSQREQSIVGCFDELWFSAFYCFQLPLFQLPILPLLSIFGSADAYGVAKAIYKQFVFFQLGPVLLVLIMIIIIIILGKCSLYLLVYNTCEFTCIQYL